MDSLPGTPQIQNIIPTTFFKTTGWAAPALGTSGSIFMLVVGLIYLEWRRRSVMAKGEGYGNLLVNEPERVTADVLPNPLLAIMPLVLVGVANFLFTKWIPAWYGASYTVAPQILPGVHVPVTISIKTVTAIWSVEAALMLGIALVVFTAFRRVSAALADGTRAAAAGALLAAINTASEYGFGAVIAALPGFVVISDALKTIPNPLVNAAVSVSTLAGITGSASGGMSIALAATSELLIKNAQAAQIPMEVLHRVVAMASGGMDTLPHNGAVITLLAVTGLTHRQSYREIFAITLIKTLAVGFVIALYYATGLV
jgi:H+/gluconate symporter-like permease